MLLGLSSGPSGNGNNFQHPNSNSSFTGLDPWLVLPDREQEV